MVPPLPSSSLSSTQENTVPNCSSLQAREVGVEERRVEVLPSDLGLVTPEPPGRPKFYTTLATQQFG